MIYPITKNLNGDPVVGIGGGAFTKTFTLRIVKKKNGDLKPAVFIRRSGDLACSTSQGYVKPEPGDLIIEGSGSLPISAMNPDIQISMFRVDQISEDHLSGEKINGLAFLDLPHRVIIGAGIYHNRDGTYFSGVIES